MIDGIEWRKAGQSSTQGGECVELSTNIAEVTYICDSKDPHGPRLALRAADLAALVGRIKSGFLDL
ncbi:DUF397 domain-containing protein [Actinomadura macrotermitis]|uniref:DUF397 domain-containing protein n=1 Tax=Actinomadura macrotermitis TaxID=2585200 RepID=A0A7K0BWP9_9ACTN|nr:hypothetical protein [Actinomadura macrotermitis]